MFAGDFFSDYTLENSDYEKVFHRPPFLAFSAKKPKMVNEAVRLRFMARSAASCAEGTLHAA